VIYFTLAAVSEAFVFALGVAVHARHELHKLKCAQAETVSDALGNSVLVDGIELPKPSDTRWTFGESKLSNGQKHYILHLNGMVRTDEIGGIYIATTKDGTAVRGDITPETKKYCAAVWKEYRSRVARKAIETST